MSPFNLRKNLSSEEKTMKNPVRPTLPKRVKVSEDGTVIFYWQRLNAIMAAWLIIDSIILWSVLSGMQTDTELGNTDYSGLSLIMLFVCMTPVLVSLYYLLGRFFNRTEFWVEGNELLIQHKPFPWPGNRAIPITEIDQFVMESDFKIRRGYQFIAHHLIVTIKGKPGNQWFPTLSRILTDLTNDTRSVEVLALQKELEILIGRRPKDIPAEK